MRHWHAIIALMVLLVTSAVLGGQSRDENWKRCQSSDPEQSIAACSTIIQSGQESDANLSDAFDSRGLAYMHKREFDQAIQDYDQAVRLNSRSATPIYNRALTYRLKGDSGRSISDYDEVLLLTPTDADSFYGRGLSYAHEGDYDHAIQDYDQALRINPSLTSAFHDRSIANVRRGDYPRALADYVRWQGILGITESCLVLVTLACAIGELRKGDRQTMQCMRRVLGWIFAAESIQYLEFTTRSIPNTIHQRSGFAVLMAPGFALLVAYISGVAWWTIWRGKSSAKGFAIAASLAQILVFARQFVAPVRLAGDYHIVALWIGIVGILAFWSHKKEWPPWSFAQREQSHLTTLFTGETSGSNAAKRVD